MSQTFTDNCFDGGNAYSTDLANMEANFTTLKTMFSGSSAPGSPIVYQPWADTSSKLLRYRNSADTAWVGVMASDAYQQVWFYLNAAINGWVINPLAYDRLLALKGGSIYVDGGKIAGSWTFDAFSHNHKYLGESGSKQRTFNSGGTEIDMSYVSSTNPPVMWAKAWAGDGYDAPCSDCYTGDAVYSSSWRPAAGVGTLQLLDIL